MSIAYLVIASCNLRELVARFSAINLVFFLAFFGLYTCQYTCYVDGLIITNPCCDTIDHVSAFFGTSFHGFDGVEGELRIAGLQCSNITDTDTDIDIDVYGKIAYVPRGSCPFIEKALKVQHEGAIGIVVYNDGDSSFGRVVMNTEFELLSLLVIIPAVFISYEDHLELDLEQNIPINLAQGIVTQAKINGSGEVRPTDIDYVSAFLDSVMLFIRMMLLMWSFLAIILFFNYVKLCLGQRKRLKIVKSLPTRKFTLETENGNFGDGSGTAVSDNMGHLSKGDTAALVIDDAIDSSVGHVMHMGHSRVPVEDKDDQVETESDNLEECFDSEDNKHEETFLPSDVQTTEPITRYFQSDSCVICLCNFEEGELITVLLCGHGYHKDCIEPWLITKSALCPICKISILPSGDSRPLEEISNDERSQTRTCDGTHPVLLIFLLIGFSSAALSLEWDG